MSDIEKFNANDLMQTVREKIKQTYADLIPDDKWETLIANEVNSYFYVEGSYGERITPFQNLIRQELKEHTKEKVKQWLEENSKNEEWSEKHNAIVNKGIENIIGEEMPRILQEVIRAPLYQLIEQLKYNITQP